MTKKILILNGSPRKKGNTSALIRAFTDGAESVGNTVTEFFLDRMNISACKGCTAGGKSPDSPCVQKDDMDQIYPAYRAADVVVLASPLYYWTVTGQLKCAIDRLFAVAESNGGEGPIKDSVLMLVAGGGAFEETINWYKLMTGFLKWTDLGIITCGGVSRVGAIEGNEKLDEARRLGASIN